MINNNTIDLGTSVTTGTLPYPTLPHTVKNIIDSSGTLSSDAVAKALHKHLDSTLSKGILPASMAPTITTNLTGNNMNTTQSFSSTLIGNPEENFKQHLENYISHLKIQRDSYINQLMVLKNKMEKLAEHAIPSVKMQLEDEKAELIEKAETFASALMSLTNIKTSLENGSVIKTSNKKK